MLLKPQLYTAYKFFDICCFGFLSAQEVYQNAFVEEEFLDLEPRLGLKIIFVRCFLHWFL